MKIIKEANDDKKDAPFLGYAKNEGMTNEKQVLALLNIARNKTAKDNDKEQDDFGPEDMAELWKNFKDIIKDNKGKKESTIKEAIDIIEAGDKFWNEAGAFFYIEKIIIQNFHLKPEAVITFEWKIENRHGTQTMTIDSFKKTYFK